MKDLSICKLCDVYGSLLTPKQREMITQYYDLDYSLAEIAENFSVSRQAVHSAIRLAAESLFRYEDSVGHIAEMAGLLDELTEIRKLIPPDGQKAANRLDGIIGTIRSEYGAIQQPE